MAASDSPPDLPTIRTASVSAADDQADAVTGDTVHARETQEA